MPQPPPDLISQLRARQAQATQANMAMPGQVVDAFKNGRQAGKRIATLYDKLTAPKVDPTVDPKGELPNGTPDPRPEPTVQTPLPDITPPAPPVAPTEGIASAAAPAADLSAAAAPITEAAPELAAAAAPEMAEAGTGLLASLAGFLADGGIADAGPHLTGPGSRGGRSFLTRPRPRGPKAFTRGLVKSPTPGRADHVRTTVRRGSYVVPADVVSGLGQGNTDAGSALLQRTTAGHGVDDTEEYADGGIADAGEVAMPVMLSGGEFVFTPKEVEAIGGGSHDHGAAALDNLVKQVRSTTHQTLAALPPPK